MKWLLCLLLLTGCATPPPALTGLYSFPAAAELHHPVLWLGAQGQFAFLGATDEPPATATNTGTYRLTGNQLALTFREAACCQFADTETEVLTLLPAAAGNLRVLFRGQTLTLQREVATP